VASFRQALTTAAEVRDFDSSIAYVDGDAGTMTIEDLEVASPMVASSSRAQRRHSAR